MITTGGELAASTLEAGACLWIFPHQGQPCTAVGYSFGLLLAVFDRLGLIPDPEDELAGAIAAMRLQQVNLRADVSVMENPAKRLAGQCFGRMVTIFGADFLVPVARRWKGQIGELAKCWAQSEEIPEANHNFVAGVINPESALRNAFVIFLRGQDFHPHNLQRTNMTKEIFMLEGIGTDFFDAPGKNRFEQMWTALHFGDYLAYYLAIAYGADPAQLEVITELKTRLPIGK
jgi:glucose/mannose-6-phosphate isomerase